MKWTKAVKRDIQRRWNNSQSMQQIADHYGVRKPQVAGVINRMREEGYKMRKQTSAEVAKEREAPPSIDVPMFIMRTNISMPADDGPGVGIMHVQRGQCRYIIAGTGENTRYCGTDVKDGSSFMFCEDHLKEVVERGHE